MLKAQQSENPRLLWEKFADEIGIEKVRQIYGDYWLRPVIPGEQVFEFLDKENNLIGWATLRPDPIEPVVWQISGVFPAHQKKGYVVEIFKWCVKTTFDLWPQSEAMFYSVSKKNEHFLEWNLARVNEKKIIAGRMNFPAPGYIVFAVPR